MERHSQAKKPAKAVNAGTSKVAAKQRKAIFIEAYIANGANATEAAFQAGFSRKSAKQRGCELLKDPAVSAALKERGTELLAQFRLTTENVLRNLAQTLFFDPRKLFNDDGSLKSARDLDDETAQALGTLEVVEMKIGQGQDVVPMYTKKLKWLDKNTAREQAMKYLGLFERDNDQAMNAVARVFIVPGKHKHAKT